jgi:hypothetical protein
VSVEEFDRKTEEVIREMSQEADKLPEVELHEDRTREMSSLSLSRMRWEWPTELGESMDALHQMIDNQMLMKFAGAYQIMNDLYMVVREPMVGAGGEMLEDAHGWPIWETNESGAYIEDFTRLGIKEVQNFLFRITTQLFAWEQTSARLWGDAMFAKAVWEEALGLGYEQAKSNGSRTVEDRTQASRLVSREERLFSLFKSTLSRQAEALVRSMQLLGQRLKDVLSA